MKKAAAVFTVWPAATTVASATRMNQGSRIVQPEGTLFRVPAGARSIPALEWKSRLAPGPIAPDSRHASLDSEMLAFDATHQTPPEILCEVAFSAVGCGLVVFAACDPVLRSGAPHSAVILDKGDAKTRELVGRRLLKLLQTTGLYMDGLEVFPVLDGRKLSEGECVVIVATWDSRSALIRSVKSLLEGDPTMQRALFRTAESTRRRKYDATAIRTFKEKGAGLHKQLFGPFHRKWRFSEFSITEKLAYAGVRLIFDFDDYDLLEQAEAALLHHARRVGAARHVKSKDVYDTDRLGDHTEMMQPRLQMFIRWNTDSARSEVALLLHEICGTRPDVDIRGRTAQRLTEPATVGHGDASS